MFPQKLIKQNFKIYSRHAFTDIIKNVFSILKLFKKFSLFCSSTSSFSFNKFNSSRFMFSLVFFLVLLFDTIQTYKKHFFNSFVVARCSRVLKIYLKNPKILGLLLNLRKVCKSILIYITFKTKHLYDHHWKFSPFCVTPKIFLSCFFISSTLLLKFFFFSSLCDKDNSKIKKTYSGDRSSSAYFYHRCVYHLSHPWIFIVNYLHNLK